MQFSYNSDNRVITEFRKDLLENVSFLANNPKRNAQCHGGFFWAFILLLQLNGLVTLTTAANISPAGYLNFSKLPSIIQPTIQNLIHKININTTRLNVCAILYLCFPYLHEYEKWTFHVKVETCITSDSE